MKKNKFLLLILVLIFTSYAVSLEYGATMRNHIDNRESRTVSMKSQTLILSSADIYTGVAFDSSNGIYLGLTYSKEYGANTPWNDFKPLLYYHYDKNKTEVYAGIFSRFDVRPLPRFLMDDSLAQYTPNIQGIHIERRNRVAFENIWIDWTSQIDGAGREAFLTGISGGVDLKGFYLNHDLLYYHLAHSEVHPKGEAVEDNAGLFISLGKRFKKLGITDSLNLNINTIISFDRNRGVTKTWHTPVGLSLGADVRLGKKWGVAVLGYSAVFKDGGGFHKVTYGETLYRAPYFVQGAISFFPVYNKYVTSELSIEINYTEGQINSRQLFKLVAAIRGSKSKESDLKQ